jgi:thiopurine S-methyltransferase
LQQEFWLDRWRTGQTGFHKVVVDAHLQKYWPSFKLKAGSRVLVPLCGKSLDLLWLRDRGHRVAGVELSAIALESFLMEHGIAARRRYADSFDIYETDGLELLRGDFFSLSHRLLPEVTAVYDRAALISWGPDLREQYVTHITSMTSPGTQTLLVAVEYPQEQMKGPPFSVSAADVDRLYGGKHSVQELNRADVLADEPRLRSRGLSELYEVCYHLTRS